MIVLIGKIRGIIQEFYCLNIAIKYEGGDA